MKSSRRATSFGSSVVSLVRLLLFVVVAVWIGYLVTQGSRVARRTSDVAATPEARRATPVLLLLSDSSATLLDQNGSSTRLTREEFNERFALETHAIEGAFAANGSVVFYENRLRTPDVNRIAKLGTPKADGASVIEIQHGAGGFPLTLRFGKRPLRDARVHGWSDPKHLLVTALVTSTRAIFDVDMNGVVRKIATLPDAIFSLEARRGALWYTTAAPGEGIESEPVPPSELHRVSADGDHLVLRDEKRLILSAVPGPNGEIAIYLNDGNAEFYPNSIGAIRVLPIQIGKRHPLLFVRDGRLVVRDGFRLALVDPISGAFSILGALPEGSVEVYEMPQTK